MTRACLTRYGPPSGFLTLLTAFSLAVRPALFHAGGTHGVLPFRAFPFAAAVTPFDVRNPPDVNRSTTVRSGLGRIADVHACTPTRASPRLGTRRTDRPAFRAWHRDQSPFPAAWG
jgi:hypothetical protein